MANFCSNCGSPVDDSASFCPNCGAQLTGSAAVQQQQAAATYDTGTSDTNGAAIAGATLVAATLATGAVMNLYLYRGRYYLDPYCRRPYGGARVLRYAPPPRARMAGPRHAPRPAPRPAPGPRPGGPRPGGGGPRGGGHR